MYKVYTKKCFDTKCDLHITLLQIRITPLGLGFPSLGAMLFNHPIRGIMPIISRLSICLNNDEEHYEVPVNRQTKNYKNQGTPRNYVSILTGSTVAVQHEDRGLQTHGTIEGKGDHNHHERSYNICITKTRWLVIRDRKHIKPRHITAEQYLWVQLQKHTATDLLEDILEQFDNQAHTNNTYAIKMDHLQIIQHMQTKCQTMERTLQK